MPTKRQIRTSEQRIWDEIFVRRFDRCLEQLTERGLEGCARWAAEQATVAVLARREERTERNGK